MVAVVAHVGHALADPLHQRLGGPHKVAYGGSVDGEQVREAHALDAHEGSWARGELLLQGQAALALYAHPIQRTGDGVVARGVDDDVQVVMGFGGLDAVGRDALDGGVLHIDEQDIVLVVDLVVAALAGQALGTKHVVLGHQHLRYHGILYSLPDLVPEEFSIVLIGRPGHHHVVEVAEPLGEARLPPQLFVVFHPFLFGNIESGAFVKLVHEGTGRLHAFPEYLREVRLDNLLFVILY